MITELFIARRLRLNSKDKGVNSSPSHAIATLGVSLSIFIMILSLAIVGGFKSEIANKIYSLDSHIRVYNAALGLDDNIYTIHTDDVMPVIRSTFADDVVAKMSLIADQSAIIKTADDFKGIVFKGVDGNFDWSYIGSTLVSGCLPDRAKPEEVLISNSVAKKLRIGVGDKIYTYFCNQKIKVRRVVVTGIFNTDFDDFDSNYLLGSLTLLQGVNGWSENTGNYVGINVKDTAQIPALSYLLFSKLAASAYNTDNRTVYNVTNTTQTNASFFSWLSLLDMNVIIIICLMAIVSGFTLISVLLMIVLERIRLIGLLKTLGADGSMIRRIFILLTQKLILRSLIIGNVLGIGLALVQKYFHIIRLNPEAYYMPYVPIQIDWLTIALLNVCVFVAAYLTLLGPSHIISSIKPSTTLRYE
ncbi:MAG: ABC transporter permease [Muribaculaceae bacterium]